MAAYSAAFFCNCSVDCEGDVEENRLLAWFLNERGSWRNILSKKLGIEREYMEVVVDDAGE